MVLSKLGFNVFLCWCFYRNGRSSTSLFNIPNIRKCTTSHGGPNRGKSCLLVIISSVSIISWFQPSLILHQMSDVLHISFSCLVLEMHNNHHYWQIGGGMKV